MPKLTVIIPCKDEIHNIRACIESVRPIADEVLVADSGSTDGTLQIVESMGDCRIIEREYVNSADFKNWAIPQASHPWVLICDADERPDKQLVQEIRALLSGTPPCDGYAIRSSTYFLGYPIRYSGQNTVRKLRLFRKDVGHYDQRRVHANAAVATGKVGELDGRFEHYTCQCLNRYAQTQNRYSTWRALDMHDAGRRVTFLGVLCRPLIRFLQFYVLRRGFLDGRAGFLMCMFTAYYTFLKYGKLWELQYSRTREARRQDAPDDHCTRDIEAHRPVAAYCGAP